MLPTVTPWSPPAPVCAEDNWVESIKALMLEPVTSVTWPICAGIYISPVKQSRTSSRHRTPAAHY